jgi:hypothetical protein
VTGWHLSTKPAQEALYQLQEESQRKLNLLLSEELELRRQLQQIEWSEGFVTVMQETLPPASFVTAWDRHTTMRSQLHPTSRGGGALARSRVLDEVQVRILLFWMRSR